MTTLSNQFSKFFWLWIPVLVFAAQLIIEALLSSSTLAHIHSEDGPHEFVQFVIMSLAFLVALNVLTQPQMKDTPLLYAWVGLAALGSLYVAGEEISWGQHVFDWTASEYWQEINDQGETNLHNTSSWLDQKPRMVLEIGIFTGGIIIPLLRRFKPHILPKRFEIIYPPSSLSVTAIFALLITIIDKIDSSLETIVIFERSSEVEELYLFYFVLLYLCNLRSRVQR